MTKKKPRRGEQAMETDDLREHNEVMDDDEEGTSEATNVVGVFKEEAEDELMRDDLENTELLDFDFEALPLHDNDKEGIVNMLTQIFLRADVDVESMAKALISRSPLGCVYLPAEDNAEDGNENVVYGLLSILPLDTKEKYGVDVRSLLVNRAKKYAPEKKIVLMLETLLRDDSKVALLVNERMLHFPCAVAKPAFNALFTDLSNNEKDNDFTDIILIMKIRIADTAAEGGKGSKRKLGQSSKKCSDVGASGDIIFDNREDQLLFQENEDVAFFEYPVQSDVEKDSKFNAVVIQGVTYRPYRRVCILKWEDFIRFVKAVIKSELK